MPYIKCETNIEIDDTNKESFLINISDFVSKLLSKPSKYIMVSLNQNKLVLDKSFEPVMYIEFKSIGLQENKCNEYSKSVCEFIESELNIPCDRIYIEFSNINGKMFGWNKHTF